MAIKNTIPSMTDPLGQHWIQPKKEDITFTPYGVSMNEISFNKLSDYSMSYPSGVYEGKMWKSKLSSGEWVLRYFIQKSDTKMNIISRKIELI